MPPKVPIQTKMTLLVKVTTLKTGNDTSIANNNSQIIIITQFKEIVDYININILVQNLLRPQGHREELIKALPRELIKASL